MATFSKIKNTTSNLYRDIHIHYPDSDLKKFAKGFCKYLNLSQDYFVNKICLDAGCGGTARGIYAMLYNRAKFAYGIDFSKELLAIH